MSMLYRKATTVNGRLVSFIGRPAQNTDAPALVFLHGWRSEAAIWQGVMREIDWPGALYAPDLPGFGQSPALESGAGVADYAAIVEGFIRKQEITRTILVGHSFGGRIAIKLAADQPQWLVKLVLTGAAGVERAFGSSLKRTALRLAAKTVRPLFAPRFMQPARRRIYRQLGSEDYLATPALTATLQQILNEDLTPLLSAIAVPTLLLWGGVDQETPLTYGQLMERSVPGSKLAVIEGAGHYVFIDQPEEFLKALKDFLHP